jgi:hypothetical protein
MKLRKIYYNVTLFSFAQTQMVKSHHQFANQIHLNKQKKTKKLMAKNNKHINQKLSLKQVLLQFFIKKIKRSIDCFNPLTY